MISSQNKIQLEKSFILIAAIILFFLCGWVMSDQGKPGRPMYIRLIFGAIAGTLLSLSLLLSLVLKKKKNRFFIVLFLILSGLASASIMTAYGGFAALLTLVFYGYVIFSIWNRSG